jgi:tRNA(adenine34) deaminase
MPDYETWMRQAIGEALLAGEAGEVPIGCVIVHEPTGQVVGRGGNRRERDHDATAHAEMVAIREAGVATGSWRLVDCAIVVTLEPCAMCAGAIVNARLPRLIYGCADPKAGAVRTLYQLCEDSRLNHRVQIVTGILSADCSRLLKDFFRAQRALGKK